MRPAARDNPGATKARYIPPGAVLSSPSAGGGHHGAAMDEPIGRELRAPEIIRRRIPNPYKGPIASGRDIQHRLIARDLSPRSAAGPIGVIHADFAGGDHAGNHRQMPLRVAAGPLEDQNAARQRCPGPFILPRCRLPPLPGIAVDAQPRTFPREGHAGHISASIARYARPRAHAPGSTAGECE
jgi:hypothetical protein